MKRDTRTWQEIAGRPARMLKTDTGLPFTLTARGEWAAWKASRRTPLQAANDNVAPRWRGNLPVLNDIAKTDPEGAYAVWAYGQQPVADNGVHGDLNACFDGEAEPEGPFEFHPERRHEIRPSINEMFADLLRVRIVTERRADCGQSPGRDRVITYRHQGPHTPPRHMGGDVIGLGDMRFNFHPQARRSPAGGLMTSYADRDGKERQPFYDTSKPRGPDADEAVKRRPTSAPAIAAPAQERVEVSKATAGVLEMILAGLHKYEIGLALRYSRHYADRGAQAHIDAAVAEVREKFPAPPRKVAALAGAA